MPQRLRLAMPADELRQPPSHCALQSRPQRTQSRHFVKLTGSLTPLTRAGPSGFNRKYPSTSLRTAPLMAIEPGFARVRSRDAKLIECPTVRYSD